MKKVISIETAACILMLLEAKFPGSEDLLNHNWKFQAQYRDLPAIACNAEKEREKMCSELFGAGNWVRGPGDSESDNFDIDSSHSSPATVAQNSVLEYLTSSENPVKYKTRNIQKNWKMLWNLQVRAGYMVGVVHEGAAWTPFDASILATADCSLWVVPGWTAPVTSAALAGALEPATSGGVADGRNSTVPDSTADHLPVGFDTL